jgi:hypothetical protein
MTTKDIQLNVWYDISASKWQSYFCPTKVVSNSCLRGCLIQKTYFNDGSEQLTLDTNHPFFFVDDDFDKYFSKQIEYPSTVLRDFYMEFDKKMNLTAIDV